MTAGPEETDRQTARALGTAGLLLVSAWAVLALVAAAIRTFDDLSRHEAMIHGRDWSSLLPLSGWLALSMMSFAAYAAVGLGVAFAVAALAVAGRTRAASGLFAVVTVCASADYVLGMLRGASTWEVYPDRMAAVSTTAGTLAAPLAGLVAAVLLLGPVIRTRRSTQEPAAAG
jgi:hypothetical protein